MFLDIFLFELKYRLRRPSFYVYIGVALIIGMLYGAILAGAMGAELALQISGGGKNLNNSPVVIHQILQAVNQVAGTFIIAAFMAVPVYRDFSYQAHSLFFTKPMPKWAYLGGRYLGSMAVVLVILLFMGVGFAMMMHYPWEEPTRIGPFHLWHYVYPYLISIIPYAFFSGSIFFGLVTLTRNELLIYLNAILLLVLFGFASNLANLIDNKTLASLLDPTGGVALLKEIEYWTVTEKNTQIIGLTPLIALNLLIWQAIGFGILAFTYAKFTFSYARPRLIRSYQTIIEKGPKATTKSILGQQVRLPQVSKSFSLGEQFRVLIHLTKMELRRLFRSPIFWILVGVGTLSMILNMVPAIRKLGAFGVTTYPVTYQMIDLVLGGYALFILILIVFYSGELIWRERKYKMHELLDVLPMPSGLVLGAKYLTLALVPYLLLGTGMIIAIISQLAQGYTNIDLGQYLSSLFFLRMINFQLFLIFCLFIQAILPNKYLGFFVSVLGYFFFNTILPLLGVEDRLLLYLSGYRLSFSDMLGYGPFLAPYLSYKAYWTGFTLLLLLVGIGLYPRGSEDNWPARFRQLRQNFRKPMVLGIAGLGLALFVGFGSYIFYNTHVLNEFKTQKDQTQLLADYEKNYKYLENKPQPRVTDIYLEIDLQPKARTFEARGTYHLLNKTPFALDSIHIIPSSADLTYDELALSVPYDTLVADTDIGFYTFGLRSPLQPGDSMDLTFVARYDQAGFPNNGMGTRVLENGSFIPHNFFPEIGYNGFFELNERSLRKEYGLPEKGDRFAPREDSTGRQYTLFARDADWLNFECIISTDPDQIAIAPGYLEREWEENGRRYFHYKMDSPMVKFFNLLSGRYTVARDTFLMYDSIPIDLEVYYHHEHGQNVPAFLDGMKKSLAYFSNNFGPYQHKVARIIEFPNYNGSFAQSFPNTISYSEASGFIVDPEASEVDLPFYGTAHEFAHQWWGHQVVSGYVQGFQFIIETMAQYSAMMVMEKELGEDQIQKYLKYELDTYLRGRSGETRKEMPAHLVEQQFYIQYNKGSLIMYALKDYIGEDSLNAALRRYVQDKKFQEAPYTTTLEWMEYIREVTPDSLDYLLTDLFETITLFDNQVLEGSYEKEGDSTYRVRMKLLTQKLRSDGEGEESEIPVRDHIDVGIFARKKVEGEWTDIPLYFEKHRFSQDTTELEIVVREKPSKVGIDPYHKLIDRNSGDNTKRVKEE
jgi:hypothetical protein